MKCNAQVLESGHAWLNPYFDSFLFDIGSLCERLVSNLIRFIYICNERFAITSHDNGY